MTRTEIADALAVLVGGGPVSDDIWSGLDVDGFCSAAERDGVAPLVAARLAGLEGAPVPLRARMRELAHHQIAVDLVKERELCRVLAGLDHAGVRALLMKGAHLAYTHYPRPDLRPRLDADILIPVAQRRVVHDLFSQLGYESDAQVGAEHVMYQRAYVRREDAVPHVVDVHWRPFNQEVFRGVLSYDEMMDEALPIPAIGPGAWGLSDVHALLLACVHRVAHHFDGGPLIWLYDIHLIAARLRAGDWSRFVDLASARGVAAICRASLQRTVERFGTCVPEAVWTEGGAMDAGEHEPTAGYLTPNRPHVKVVLDDLRALPTWADRWRLLREHTFPPIEYMQGVYAPSSTMPLFWLYARRIVLGTRKWLARS